MTRHDSSVVRFKKKKTQFFHSFLTFIYFHKEERTISEFNSILKFFCQIRCTQQNFANRKITNLGFVIVNRWFCYFVEY